MAWLQCRSRASGPSYGAGGHKKLAQQAPHLPTPAKRLAQREAMCAISAKRLSQHAIKRPFWAILPALGKYFRAIAIDSRRWANFVAPTLLTAPQDETVDTNAETPGRPHETHDAFARENCAENRCIWLAMVSSVSPETKHTPAKAMAVSRELPAHRRATAVCCGGHRRDRRAWLRCPWAVAGPGRASRRRAEPYISNQAPLLWRAPEGPEGLAAVPVGGGRAWPGFETTRQATHQQPSATAVEGAGGSGGHGWASRSTTPSRRLACGDLAGSRALRRPEHQRRHTTARVRQRGGHRSTRPLVGSLSHCLVEAQAK